MAQKIKKLSKKFIALICMFTLVFSYSVVGVNESDAAALTTLKDTLSDSRATESANHTVVFTSTTAIPDTSGTIVIDFPSDFDMTGKVAANMTLVDTNGTRTLADTTPTASADGVVVDGTLDKITITLCTTTGATCAIEAGNVVTFTLASVTNPATGVYQIDIDTTSDSGSVAVAILGADTGVAVTATIDAYINFTINTAAVGFGSWNAGSTAKRWADTALTGLTSEPTDGNSIHLAVSTNGEGGASITARSLNGKLSKTVGTADEIGAVATYGTGGVTAGAEGYGIYADPGTATTGAFVVEDTFDNDVSGQAAISTANQVIAISNAAALATASIDVNVQAAISATTLAGSYSDTLVFVATATY